MGLRHSYIFKVTLPPPSLTAELDQSTSPVSEIAPFRSSRDSILKVSFPADKSAPAQNPLPDPVTIIALMSSSLFALSIASIKSSCICLLKAFNFSGLFNVIVKIFSSTSYKIAV